MNQSYLQLVPAHLLHWATSSQYAPYLPLVFYCLTNKWSHFFAPEYCTFYFCPLLCKSYLAYDYVFIIFEAFLRLTIISYLGGTLQSSPLKLSLIHFFLFLAILFIIWKALICSFIDCFWFTMVITPWRRSLSDNLLAYPWYPPQDLEQSWLSIIYFESKND